MEGRNMHVWHWGSGVMLKRFQRRGREGTKPSGATYSLKSSDTKRHQGGSCACTHAHGPACTICSSPDRQQWLRGHQQKELSGQDFITNEYGATDTFSGGTVFVFPIFLQCKKQKRVPLHNFFWMWMWICTGEMKI